jgi:CheY-like chemotaxis protein
MTLSAGSRVLVVDDDPFIRHILQAILEAEGYVVLLAENGVDGLELLKHQTPLAPLTLVLLDVMMPKMTGIEMLIELRKDPQLYNLPVLMLTAEGGPEDVARGYAAGASFYMTKPFDREQLLKGIQAALNGPREAAS